MVLSALKSGRETFLGGDSREPSGISNTSKILMDAKEFHLDI